MFHLCRRFAGDTPPSLVWMKVGRAGSGSSAARRDIEPEFFPIVFHANHSLSNGGHSSL